jgi:muramoyltetrapeptide carboxypeptidase
VTPLKPPRLREGDTIGIVAPCSPVLPPQRESYERGKRALRDMGFQLKEGQTVRARPWYYGAGRPQDQAADIHAMFVDPDVKALIATSGGYSAVGVLERLDYELIKSHPKPFIGMSDMTAYHISLYAQTGLVGFHMDEVIGLGETWPKHSARAAVIKPAYLQVLTSHKPLENIPSQSPEVWRDGTAEGRLIGGILPLLAYGVGTPYGLNPQLAHGGILFWESTGRGLHEVRRMLFQLKYAGILKALAGMVIGSLTNTPPAPNKKITEPTAQDIVLEVTDGYTFPIMAGLEFGHYMVNRPMPIGVRAKLDTTAKTLELLEGAVV